MPGDLSSNPQDLRKAERCRTSHVKLGIAAHMQFTCCEMGVRRIIDSHRPASLAYTAENKRLYLSVTGFLFLQRNTMAKKQLVQEWVYPAYTSILLFIIEGSQKGTQRIWRQEMIQRESVAY